jgi:2'-5' RNA ligase
MKRLFAALKIHPDGDFLSAYRNLQTAMRLQQIKWVEEHNIHITLKFFGDTEEHKIPRISRIFFTRAEQTPVPVFRLKGLGIFGSRYDPRVVWTGIEPYQELVCLMTAIRDDLIPAGYEPDRQNLVPHLTLGRIKQVKDRKLFDESLKKYEGITSAPMNPGEIILYESILRREGPEYRVLKAFKFKP